MDTISDTLTRIRNAQAAGRERTSIPFSRINFCLLEILVKEGFIVAVEKVRRGKNHFLEAVLKYDEDKKGAIESIRRVSKPSQRIYFSHQEIRPIRQGFGRLIISTSKGLMTGEQAKRQKLGGEAICEIW